MAVINITPDSFSDGGRYLDPYKALTRASECLSEGADVLDLGAQSTRPGSIQLSADDELFRLEKPLSLIRNKHPNAIISVDTYYSKVASKAIDLGADWINDVSGGRQDPNIFKVALNTGCPYVLTHSRGDSQSMDKLTQYNDVSLDVLNSLRRQSQDAIDLGISKNKIIWDIGIGFAKNNQQNIDLLRNLELFTQDGFPTLVGPSRKRFIGNVLNEADPEQRLWGTASVVCRCVQASISMVRVHDVKQIKQAITMYEVIKNNS